MAEVALEYLLEKLRQLLIYHADFIRGVEEELKKMDSDLRLLKPFLKDFTEGWRKDGGVRELVRDIRGVVYQAEDIIDDILEQEAERQRRRRISLRRGSSSRKSLKSNISEQLESVSNKLSKINEERIGIESSIQAPAGEDKSSIETQQASSIRDDNLVGLEDETKTLMGYLTEETQQLDVISIIGVPGLGKTTLARKIFCDRKIESKFPILIWVHISQGFTMKDVFLAILNKLRCTEDVFARSSRELAHVVATILEKEKFLIVVDNLQTVNDWDQFETALPKGNKMGKVLITSCNEEIGWHVSRARSPHKLRALNKKESWALLKYEVFGTSKSPPKLEELGRLIAEQCGGIPLALVVMGGVLKRDYSSSLDVTLLEWTKAYESIHWYINQRNYEDVPNQLRDCFLYLGMFPEDYEISVAKLISLWIAEGFIPQVEGSNLEATAEKYLEELISMNLIQICKFKSDGKARTCHIHHKLREFCKTEAGHENENLLQEINKTSLGEFEPPLSDLNKFRRLCIHSNVVDFFSQTHSCPDVRSFLCLSKDIGQSLEVSSVIPASFKRLKVLNVNPIRLSEIPKGIHNLIHLKYIALSIIDLSALPAAFSELSYLESLTVDTTHPTLAIKADIWKMLQLRCLKTNASACLPKPSRSNESEGEQLQTLGKISPESCTGEVFDKARKLKKLAIHGGLAFLLNSNAGSFDSFAKLSDLEKLKLINNLSSSSEGQLSLPPASKFPPRLEYLTLSATRLDWHQMSILGSLERLKVLKLKDGAFMGKTWQVVDGSFRNLEVLHIEYTDLVSWEASGHHFPKLRRVLLKNCEKLAEVPIGLADVPTLQLLDLNRVELAAPSANKIYGVIRKNVEQKNIKDSGFKLRVFPPYE